MIRVREHEEDRGRSGRTWLIHGPRPPGAVPEVGVERGREPRQSGAQRGLVSGHPTMMRATTEGRKRGHPRRSSTITS